ncbi:MAG: hypothetical protein LBC84_05900 [Prevotellaceae bacterium]|nr:hypothetical protein [Prevotellaceae bacterium]
MGTASTETDKQNDLEVFTSLFHFGEVMLVVWMVNNHPIILMTNTSKGIVSTKIVDHCSEQSVVLPSMWSNEEGCHYCNP